jgi:hypothetical protein
MDTLDFPSLLLKLSTKVPLIYCQMGKYKDSFFFDLHADGTGTLYDYAYAEQVEFKHFLSTQALLDIKETKQTEADLTFVDHETGYYERKIRVTSIADLEPSVCNTIEALFWLINDNLQNPIGEPPPNEELTLARGTAEEFEKILCAMFVLSNYISSEDELWISLKPDSKISYISGLPLSLKEALELIIDVFRPRQITYEYFTHRVGRRTSYDSMGPGFDITADIVTKYFSCARERLEARQWLIETLDKYGQDIRPLLPTNGLGL